MVLVHGDPDAVLSNGRLRASLAIRDWILGEAREIGDPNIILPRPSVTFGRSSVHQRSSVRWPRAKRRTR
jgi:hypothetical protein